MRSFSLSRITQSCGKAALKDARHVPGVFYNKPAAFGIDVTAASHGFRKLRFQAVISPENVRNASAFGVQKIEKRIPAAEKAFRAEGMLGDILSDLFAYHAVLPYVIRRSVSSGGDFYCFTSIS